MMQMLFRIMPLSIRLSIGLCALAIVLFGCGKSDEKGATQKEPTLIDSVPLVNYNPMLDAKVRPDSMISDLLGMIPAGFIVEADMKNSIGPYVAKHGGIEHPDSTLLAMTYRELLNRSLTQDMSGGVAPCEGCTDSVLILMPGGSSRIYLGKGHSNLQKMIRTALQESEDVSSDYDKTPLTLPVDTASWRETIRTAMNGREDIDWILFGNALLLLARDGKNPSDYTYARVLTAVDKVKEMDGFEDVHRLFERSKAHSPQS